MKKNLRKLLTVVLVVVLALSFGAIGASAANFTDTASSNYKEAVDVMSNIGVINGMTATTFDPTGSLTREQAAKIVCYMLLGPTNAALISSASSQTFSDVTTSRWSSGYIDYCASQGIIVGNGDGTFNPTGTLTTAAFTKMLLVAAGYNASSEGYVGANWAVNVASDALEAGIYDSNIIISATATCTREQAAQLAFKTLAATLVQYSGGSSVTVNGVTITTGATRSNVTAAAGLGYDGVNDSLKQFCEKYFSKLTYDGTAVTDAFGRPAHSWTNNTTLVGTYADTAVVTYSAATTAAKIATDLNGYKIYDDTNSAWVNVENITTYTNGGTAFDTDAIVNKNNAGGVLLAVAGATDETIAKALADETANGKLVQIFTNTSKQITAIVEITYKVGKISNVVTTSTSTVYSLATPAGVTDGTYTDYANDTLFTDTISGQTGMAKGDVITYVALGGTAYVYKTTSVSGTATNYATTSSGNTVTVSGTTYTVGAAVTNSSTFAASSTAANYFIDQYGFAVLTTATAASTNYAFIVGKYGTLTTDVNGTVPSAQVKAVKADGTVANYTLSLTKLTSTSAQVTTPTAAANNPAGAALDFDAVAPVGNDSVKLVAGDYVITGTNIMVYDDSEGAANTAGIGGTVDTAVGTLADVYGYTLSGSTISVQPLTAIPAGDMTTGSVYFDTSVDDLYYGKTTGSADNAKTALIGSGTVYVVFDSAAGTAALYTGSTGLPTTVTSNDANDLDGTNVVMTANATTTGTANYVFVTVSGGLTVATTTNYVYINSAVFGTSLNSDGATVYTYTGTKADGTTVSLTSTGDALNVAGVYTYTTSNTVADANLKAQDTDADPTDGYGYDTLTVTGDLVEVDGSYYNITSATQIVYIDSTKATVDGNLGYVVLASNNGALTNNVATIYIVG